MSKLRAKLIKLAYENPELRDEILPLIREAGDEGTSYMAVSHLQKIADQANQLLGMIDKFSMLDDWVESHITEAAAKMDDVYEHLRYPNDGPGAKVARADALVYKAKAPSGLEAEMKKFRVGLRGLPQEFVEWHKTLAVAKLKELGRKFGVQVLSTKLVGDGWMDGMKTLRAEIETGSGKTMKLRWKDNGLRGGQWMSEGRGSSLVYESDLT